MYLSNFPAFIVLLGFCLAFYLLASPPNVFRDRLNGVNPSEVREHTDLKLTPFSQLFKGVAPAKVEYILDVVRDSKKENPQILLVGSGNSGIELGDQLVAALEKENLSAKVTVVERKAKLASSSNKKLTVHSIDDVSKMTIFEDASFDVVVSDEGVAERIAQASSYFKELSRLVKKQGHLVVNGIERTFFSFWLVIRLLQPPISIFPLLPSNNFDWRLFLTTKELDTVAPTLGLQRDGNWNGIGPSFLKVRVSPLDKLPYFQPQVNEWYIRHIRDGVLYIGKFKKL